MIPLIGITNGIILVASLNLILGIVILLAHPFMGRHGQSGPWSRESRSLFRLPALAIPTDRPLGLYSRPFLRSRRGWQGSVLRRRHWRYGHGPSTAARPRRQAGLQAVGGGWSKRGGHNADAAPVRRSSRGTCRCCCTRPPPGRTPGTCSCWGWVPAHHPTRPPVTESTGWTSWRSSSAEIDALRLFWGAEPRPTERAQGSDQNR